MNDVTATVSDEPVQQTGLTPKQESQWGDTTSMMAWTAPGFRHIWYKMLSETHNNGGSQYTAVMSRDVPCAATDGKNMILNPDTFFEFSLPERVFVAAHEIVHNVYGDVELLHRCQSTGCVPLHDGSSLPFDSATMQKAMDLRINALLKSSRIGKPPEVGHFDDAMTGEESVLDVYAKHYKKKPDGEDGDEDGPGGKGQNPGGFDTLMKPGQSTGQNAQQAASQRNPQQWAVEIAAAQTIEQMRSQGKIAAALKRMFKELLEPEVPWTDHIQTIINRVGSSGGWDWRVPDPWFIGRDIYQPSKTGRGAGWIVVWGDTSGSRGDDEIASNIAELASIIEDVNPARLTLIWCDAAIEDGSVIELDSGSDLRGLKPVGGGGTEVEPVYAWIAESMETPDLFIGFTDGYVTFPREPKYPVIWASSTAVQYPYGEVVKVNRRQQRP
jgi:predicted metal-dependent peptidase